MLEKEIQECRQEMLNILRGPIELNEMTTVMSAYLLFLSYDIEENKTKNLDDLIRHAQFADDSIKCFVIDKCDKCIPAVVWERLISLTNKYSKECFGKIVLSRNDDLVERWWKSEGGCFHTPMSIERLGIRLLDIQQGNEIADLCCGTGNTTIALSAKTSDTTVVGVEMNSQACSIARIRAAVSDTPFEIKQNDVFTLINDKKTFDRIFMDHPFGMRAQSMSAGKEYLENKLNIDRTEIRIRSGDWLFNRVIMDLLSENGKAVTIMTNGSTWNIEDQAIREWFVNNQYIESIISLPQALYLSMGIGTTMIVLSRSKRENKGIYMVDATESCVKGRRKNEFSDENIDLIVSSLDGSESSIGHWVSNEEIEENNFVLNPERYLAEKIEIKDGVAFNSVIKNITRGASIRASELDKMTSKMATDYQYMMLSNIQNGIIVDPLPYLTDVDDNLSRYCIKNHSLLISKNGEPYKIAIAEIPNGKTILANGNLYVIELDEEKVNPYYLKAFFESEKGKAQLHSITVGSVMPCIGVKDLKDLIIPLPSMAEQEKVVNRYLCLQDEIKLLHIKLDKAIAKLSHVFSEDEEM